MPARLDRTIPNSRLILDTKKQGIDVLKLSDTQEMLEGMHADAFTRIDWYATNFLVEPHCMEYKILYNTYLDNEVIYSERRVYNTNDPRTPTDELVSYTIT